MLKQYITKGSGKVSWITLTNTFMSFFHVIEFDSASTYIGACVQTSKLRNTLNGLSLGKTHRSNG